MAYDAYPNTPLVEQDRRHVWLERLLLFSFIVCLLIGLTAFGIWWTLRNASQPALTDDPLQAIRTERILPQLALRQLAGDAGDGLAAQAVQAGQAETARAILTYDAAPGAIARAARLTQLGRLYLDAGDLPAAAQVLRLVEPSAILNSAIHSLERAQLLVQVAESLYAAKQPAAALDAAIQAERVAAEAPDLLPAQRSQVFIDLKSLAGKLGAPDFEQRISDLARNPYLAPQGSLVPQRLSTFAQQLPYDATTTATIAARQQAARLLADRIAQTGGVDIDPERQALAQALRAEDQARTQFYQATLGNAISLPQQTWVLQDRLEWLLTKLRIAHKDYGISLFPEWEQQSSQLLQDVGGAYRDVLTTYDAQAAAMPTPQEQALQRVENQRWLAEQAERGLFTAFAPSDISEQLRIVQDDAANQGAAPAMRVTYDQHATPPGFRIEASK